MKTMRIIVTILALAFSVNAITVTKYDIDLTYYEGSVFAGSYLSYHVIQYKVGNGKWKDVTNTLKKKNCRINKDNPSETYTLTRSSAGNVVIGQKTGTLTWDEVGEAIDEIYREQMNKLFPKPGLF